MDQYIYEPDEIAIRFSHRLVKIHVFPNGNGRHSRLFADIMITNLFNKPFFSWGGADLTKSSNLRKEYLLAIYKADEGFIQPLINFSRS
jgi:fido (protein-threonine AMPylation protein)